MYFYLFLQSNLLEWPIYLTQTPPVGQPWLQRFWSRAGFITIMNSITHPVVYFVIMNMPQTYIGNVLCAEFFAIGAEMLVLRHFWGTTWRRSFGLSLLANLLSWQVAPMLTYALFQNG